MKGALVVCLVLVNIISQGLAEEKSSYPIASPLANFKWRIYNPRSVTSRYAIITQYIANSSLVVVPEQIHKISVKKIERSAFFRCSTMNQIIFPDTVNHIGSSAFNRCSELSKIIIPKEVTIIRASTFFRCFNLNSVQISENVYSIREYAFSHCRNLKEIIIPSKVTSIENNAFAECHS
ncbi:leucine-rich repeat domain-containing protein, partial [Verrucomicrobiales bacterium]|nr:leucine-rich repeat domain-containing protein [Verrucomicrobiales bacterium]